MAAHQYISGLVDTGGGLRRPPVVGMAFLHERAMRAGNLRGRSPLFDPQYLVSLLLGHAPASAAPTLPRVSIALSCRTPAGKTAVEISL